MTLYIERLTLRLFHIFIHNEDWIILLYVFSSKEKHILVVYLSFPRREQFKWENARIHGNIRVERQESDSPEYSAFSFFFLFWAQTIAMHFSSKSALERKTNYVYSLLLPYSYHLYFHSFINCLNHSSTRNHYEPKNHTVHNIVVSTSRSDQIIMYNSCNCVHGVLYVDATQMNGIFNSIMLSCYLWEKWSSIHMIAMHSFFFFVLKKFEQLRR